METNNIPLLPAVLLFSFLIYLFYVCLVHPLFFSPLRHIPQAHPLARFSSLWINYIRHQHRENFTLFQAHSKYGPIICLGPREISVNCVDDGLRTIYQGGFEKHAWYANLFSNYDGVHVMFSTIDSAPHSGRKRMLSNAYSKSYLQSSPTVRDVARHVVHDRLFPYLRREAANQEPVNIRRLVECTTMDLVNGYIFGMRAGSNFIENKEEAQWWLSRYQSRKAYTFWPQEMPRLNDFFSNLGIHLSPEWVANANHDLEEWTLDHCDISEDTLRRCEEGDDTDIKSDLHYPVIYGQLRAQLKRESSKSNAVPLSKAAPHRIQIASELLDHLSAGHETSSITLTFLFYELSLRPSLQRRLQTELKTIQDPVRLQHIDSEEEDHRTGQSQFPIPAQLDSLPLLHAILMETLRLHQAIPGPQPRVTPRTQSGTRIGNVNNIPDGIRVSSNAFCLHRNPDVFPQPEVWLPERWLRDPKKDSDKEEARVKEMHRWFWAFGSGGRMCIGSNLAMLQMKIIIAAILCFRLELASLDEERMPTDAYLGAWTDGQNQVEPLPNAPILDQEDAYTAQPLAKRVMLKVF